MAPRKRRARIGLENLGKIKRKQLAVHKKGADKSQPSKAISEPPVDPLHIAKNAQMHMWKTFQEITTDTWTPNEPQKGQPSLIN